MSQSSIMSSRLSPSQLRLVTDPDQFEFTTTAEIEPGLPCLGQERAVEALRTGLSIPGPGFHILALGAEGIGRTDCILSVMSEFNPTEEAAVDRCLLPASGQYGAMEELQLPTGRGRVLVEGCAGVVRAIRARDRALCERFIADLRESFADEPQLADFLAQLEEQSSLLLSDDLHTVDMKDLLRSLPQLLVPGETAGIPYQIDRSADPVSLLGSCSLEADSGRLIVSAGSLLQASGGCLLIDGRPLAENIDWWRTLRNVLRTGYIPLGALPVAGQTQPSSTMLSGYMPLSAKVILLCDPFVLDRLQGIEPDMERIFPVIAEFTTRVERNDQTIDDSVRIMSAAIQRYACLPFDRSAIATMMDVSSMMAGARDRLSLYRSGLSNLLREASHLANLEGRDVVTANDVHRVIDQRRKRVAIAAQESMQAIMKRETLVELSGSVVGQANGLTVVGSGVQAYVEPARITATVRAGDGSIVDIERETDLGGSIHSKGIMILAGLLGSRYSPHEPLSLVASLVIEQNYSELDGDSASVAEMLALLSAIADVPLSQSLAITGSIDQRGQVQCIGDVNFKIEGYFDLCRMAGLDGSHGVVIPAGNINDLMLKDDLIEAVEQGKFSIHSVESLEEVIELLAGMPAGEADDDGRYPAGSFNHSVAAAIHRFAEDKRQQEHKDD